ncbi:GIY-YIG nuclease family protein [Mycobacterium avium]|uniref:GIY-YIG nuclease family protein n=1 Tax=Mycobacterium avium TaxID=1764 RepID=UPI001EE39B66|nr:GIY-YIG nuclease family protein [Mycobacterium avium]
MTTSTETELPPEEVETVGSAVVSRRIYAYTLPGKDAQPWERTLGGTHSSGTGLIKVGDTTKADVLQRIKQQLGTAYPHLEGVTLLLDTEAQRNDGTAFRDHDVHRALVAKGIRKDAEWFEATIDEVQAAIVAVRNGQSYDGTRTADFGMRPEQEEAVAQTAGYYRSHAEDGHAPRFLWNAKMRFGKTFTTYQLAREMGWKRVLVLTYKPVVQTAWKEDLLTHVDFEGWRFVDRESSPDDRDAAADSADPVVWFASFQDMRGKTADGNIKKHNEVIHLIDWDAIVLDEYHFGAWRDSARELYDPTEAEIAEAEEPDESVTEDDLGLTSRHYLYLSGTPFRAITNGEFTEDQIFNWTYVDEQREKEHWDAAAGPNPYIDLPGMQIFSYDIGGDAEKWAADEEFDGFSLNEYFKAKKLNPKSNSTAAGAYEFEDPNRVHEFLEMLRGTLPEQMKLQIVGGQKPPFPYQAPVFAQAITHSVWYLNDVAGCYAMRDALLKHPYFKTFEIVAAAGSGVGMGKEAKKPVMDAINRATKAGTGSITLTCGKLMTGVTVREWGAILMLRSLKSPETYFQAAFRVQSPRSKRLPDGTLEVLKDPVYVFEFDPNRALTLVGEYGMRLGALGDTTPQEAIGQLLNYLPIFAFAGGMMTELDAADVLNWATTGVGATALAQRWNSPLLVNINEQTLTKLLDHPELLEALGKIEDFRNLANTAEQIVTSSKLLKKAKRENDNGKLNRAQKKEQSETAKRRKEIREKLQKLLAKIPVFMYVTQIREQALKDIILGVDGPLFERVTGLSIADFKLLNDIGVFNPIHMDAAIYQFKAFENSSLEYADDPKAPTEDRPTGLWDRVLQPGEDIDEVLAEMEAEQKAEPAPGPLRITMGKAKKMHKRKKK